MTTPSYSTMVGQQGKINSCYITRTIGSRLYQAETGWVWMGTESGAPLHFAAFINNSGPQYVWYIDWFTPGTKHHYRIRHLESNRWAIYIDYTWRGVVYNTGFSSGWSHVGGERYRCGGNAEFDYCEKWNGSAWSPWTRPTNWDTMGPYFSCDNDTFYRFERVGSLPSQRCRIRPGWG